MINRLILMPINCLYDHSISDQSINWNNRLLHITTKDNIGTITIFHIDSEVSIFVFHQPSQPYFSFLSHQFTIRSLSTNVYDPLYTSFSQTSIHFIVLRSLIREPTRETCIKKKPKQHIEEKTLIVSVPNYTHNRPTHKK